MIQVQKNAHTYSSTCSIENNNGTFRILVQSGTIGSHDILISNPPFQSSENYKKNRSTPHLILNIFMCIQYPVEDLKLNFQY